jgi:HK97 family phage major capsid protein
MYHYEPATPRLERLTQSLTEATSKARTLAAKAEGDGRDFTPGERGEAEKLVAEIKDLRGKIRAEEGDNALRRQMYELGDGIGLAPGSATSSDWRKSSGAWGSKVLDYHAKVGAKSLLVSGSVPVTVPLNPDPVRSGERVQFLRQLITAEPAPGGRFAYLRQTVRTNNAAPVAEGALKPTSVYTMERVEDRCRTIAHLTEPIPRQQLDDAALLRQFVDAELRYGLELALDAQILTGDGTGENLTGILNTTGRQAQAWAADVLTTTRKAVTALELDEQQPTAWTFNPSDWENVETAAAEQYAANPNQPTAVDRQARSLWGLPVVVTTAMPTGTGLLGDFRGSVRLEVAEDARVDWSENVYDATAGASDFQRNLVRFRCEGRFGLAVMRPRAFVEVDMAA